MQQQGLLFVLFMLIIIPIIMLSANHNVFFILLAIVLSVVSVRSIFSLLLNRSRDPEEMDDELMEELEETVNVDIKRFGIGTKVVRSLIAILFYVYSLFYIHRLWLKIIIIMVILHWMYIMANNIGTRSSVSISGPKRKKLNRSFLVFVNLCAIVVIVLVAYNKFVDKIF